ncbi:TerC family protein [Parasediminibacterium sp. JCM 36343]|uniref:TerC family protein n=1 Tax=Parasediminibacterium sp. JCM 36343 TaxID=3374279 RepID=UPI00397E4E10
MQELLRQIIDNPIPSLLMVASLIVIESLLSVDNAAVLATMVMDLPTEQRKKALKYGIVGAYVFRGLALLFATFLVKFWFLKPLGGGYLLYLVWGWWRSKQKQQQDTGKKAVDKSGNWLYRAIINYMGSFWATVALVELMDMAFSIDNVFAAVAFSKNIIIIWLGVFTGMLAMRFVAQAFVNLMEKYPFLETSAFAVIALLGAKLLFSLYAHFSPCSNVSKFIEGDAECLQSNGLPIPEGHAMVWGDVLTSIATVSIFTIPIITSWLFNFPERKQSGR